MRPVAWILVPALVLGAAEAVVRQTVDRVQLWYAAAESVAGDGRIDVLFVGTSRVATAVYVPAFEEAVRAGGGRTVRALNLGRGDATYTAHYLGLRNLFARHPRSFEGVHVLLEAPARYSPAVTWSAPWVGREQPWILTEVMRGRDLPRFWSSRGASLEQKIHVTVRVMGRGLALLKRRERFRELLLRNAVPRLAGRLGGWAEVEVAREKSSDAGRDLLGMGGGGTRTGEKWFAFARSAVERAAADIRAQAWLPPWAGSLQEAIVDLVRAQGGEVLFFEVPTSPVYRSAFDTAVQIAGQRRFEEWRAAQNLRLLEPDFSYTESDLPDWSHLDARRAPEFSAALGRAWASQIQRGP